jgi:hypothetical protein
MTLYVLTDIVYTYRILKYLKKNAYNCLKITCEAHRISVTV